jgi:hypothetical protein
MLKIKVPLSCLEGLEKYRASTANKVDLDVARRWLNTNGYWYAASFVRANPLLFRRGMMFGFELDRKAEDIR